MRSMFSAEVIDGYIIVKDEDGPMTVTNDAERVTEYLVGEYGNKRIFYRDSQGAWDELNHLADGRFTGFGIHSARDWRTIVNNGEEDS